MDVKKEIEYRKEIMQLLYEGKKIEKSDREWLVTHPIYIEEEGFLLLKKDVIKVPMNEDFQVKVELVANNSKHKISPLFVIPLKKGSIHCEYNIKDTSGAVLKGKQITVLSTCNSDKNPVCTFHCFSKSGLLGVLFECETKDHRGVRYMMDSTVATQLVMKKTVITANKIQYSCSDIENKEIDKYVFTVEWNHWNTMEI